MTRLSVKDVPEWLTSLSAPDRVKARRMMAICSSEAQFERIVRAYQANNKRRRGRPRMEDAPLVYRAVFLHQTNLDWDPGHAAGAVVAEFLAGKFPGVRPKVSPEHLRRRLREAVEHPRAGMFLSVARDAQTQRLPVRWLRTQFYVPGLLKKLPSLPSMAAPMPAVQPSDVDTAIVLQFFLALDDMVAPELIRRLHDAAMEWHEETASATANVH
jgi:hypothetical protein